MKIYLSNESVIQSCSKKMGILQEKQKQLDFKHTGYLNSDGTVSEEAIQYLRNNRIILELETLKSMAESNTDLNCEVTNHEFLLLRGEI